MKRFLCIPIAAALLALSGCVQPEPDPQPTPNPPEESAYVTLDSGQSTSVSSGYEGTEFTIGFKTNRNWTTDIAYGSSGSGWVSLSSSSGQAGSQTLIASVKANDAESKRTAVITITAGDASASVTVSQDPFVSEFSITPNSFDAGSEGRNIEVKVTSNIGYHVSSVPDWIHPVETKAAQTKSLFFTVDANPSASSRSGIIVICNDNEVCIPVNVTQKGSAAFISISSSELSFGAARDEESLQVTANTSWTATSLVDWCTVTPSSGEGAASVKFKVTENTVASAREGKVRFSTSDGAGSVELTVSQSGAEAAISVSVSSISFVSGSAQKVVNVSSNASWTVSSGMDWCTVTPSSGKGDASVTVSVIENSDARAREGKITFQTMQGVAFAEVSVSQEASEAFVRLSPSEASFTSAGGQKTVRVSSNTSWKASSLADWCTVSPEHGSGDASITVKVLENSIPESRSGVIVIATYDGSSSVEFSVSQEASPVELSVSANRMDFASESDVKALQIMSNSSWTITSQAEWCTVSQSSGHGYSNVEVKVTENGNTYSRDTKLVVKAGSEAVEVTVVQKGGKPVLEVSDSEFSLQASGDVAAFSIMSNADWVINTGAAWLSASKDSGSGNSLITLTAGNNPEVEKRTAEVMVRTVDGTIRKKITVTQAGGDPTLEMASYSQSFDHRSGSVTVGVSSNVGWTVQSSENWCTVSKNAASTAFTVNVQANESGKRRSATILVKTSVGGLEKTFTVTQSTPDGNEGFGDDGGFNWDK